MSAAAFHRGLYIEHFEEIAGKYEARLSRLDDGESTLEELGDLDARIAAHLDGLVLGGEPALDVARSRFEVRDASSLHAFVALACWLDCFELVELALARLEAFAGEPDADPRDLADARKAMVDALVQHLPTTWADSLTRALWRAGPQGVVVLGQTVGVRWADAPGIAEVLDYASTLRAVEPTALLWALARCGGVRCEALHRRLASEDPRLAMPAAVGMLRRGSSEVVDVLAKRASERWSTLLLALCSGPTFGRQLLADAHCDARAEQLIGLGLLGDPECIDVLRSQLVGDQGHAAALGLFLLTGALLKRERPPHDAAREDDDDLDELDEREVDDAPLAWLSRASISTDPEAWARWLDQYGTRLRPGARHRLGVLGSPLADLEAVTTVELPLPLRRLLIDELVIRYGVGVGLDPELPEYHQLEILARMRAELDGVRTEPGTWCVGRRCVA
ncbi:hypothetical protein ACNOYE_00540 [Nannocystaceae bacterium ST9]